MQRLFTVVLVCFIAIVCLVIPTRVLETTPNGFGPVTTERVTSESSEYNETGSNQIAVDKRTASTDTQPAWRFETDPVSRQALTVSGLDDFPSELVQPIEPLAPPKGNRLALDLGGAGYFEAPIQARSVHANGDQTILVRADTQDLDNHADQSPSSILTGQEPVRSQPADQAVITYGNSGMFGRIQHESGLYLVHSDAAGSWLINLNDDRLSIDPFDHDTLGESATSHAEHSKQPQHAGDVPIADASANSADKNNQRSGRSSTQSTLNLNVIDVMFAYTPAIQARYPGDLIDTRFNHLVSIANQTFVDSSVRIAVRLVGREQVNYDASQINNVTLENLQRAIAGEGSVTGFENLASRRNQLGADIVAFTWPHDIETRGSCGVAFLPVFENGAYNPDYGVHIDNDGFSNWSVCSDAVFTHELGHNLNAEHQRARSSGDDPARFNYAFVEIGRFHTIMGSFGTGDQDRYRRLDRFSNPFIQCGNQACGSFSSPDAANNAREIIRLGPNLAGYREAVDQSAVTRPVRSERDQDGDGLFDQDDPFPFDPFNDQANPDPEPELVFSPRQLAQSDSGESELLVVSSGSDQVLAFSTDGEFRSIAVAPQRVNPGPILSDFSDMLVDQQGRITLLSSGDVRRYDRLSGRLIEVFLSSRRPVPNDLLSAFPRALATLPNDQLIVLGDNAIERYDAIDGFRLTSPLGAEPTTDPADWNRRLDLSLRAAAQWALKLYVAEATENRVLRFSAATGAREADLAGPGNGLISDPRDMIFDANGLLYLANGSAGNVLRFNPTTNQFVDTFIAPGTGGLNFARALAFGPDGDLYVADRDQNAVFRFDGETGAFKSLAVQPGQAGLDQPEALAFVPRLAQTVVGTSGHFYAPERSGEGYLLERLDDNRAAISWFTYPPAGIDSDQAWLFGVGEIVDQTVEFDELLSTTGLGFGTEFDSNSFQTEVWGELSLEFYDCNSGIARWQGPEAWGSGQQRFDRLIEIPGLPCGSEPLPPQFDRPGISGQWFEPSRSGQGWFIQEIKPGQLFIAWYSYTSEGEQLWLVGLGEINNGVARFDELTRPAGTVFGENFNPNEVKRVPWGQLTITFSDCANAVAEYTALDPEIGSGVLFPQRLTSLEGLDCEVP